MSLENRINRLEQRMGLNRGAATGPCVIIGAGTDYEIEVPLRLMPSIEQLYRAAPGGDPVVRAAWERHAADRRARAEETMRMFEDEEEKI